MISINSTQTIQIFLGGSVSTNELAIVATYTDANQSQNTWLSRATRVLTTSGASTVTAVTSPSSSTVNRDLNRLSIRNRDTSSATVTVQFNDNGSTYEIIRVTLASGDQLYMGGNRWFVVDATGRKKRTAA